MSAESDHAEFLDSKLRLTDVDDSLFIRRELDRIQVKIDKLKSAAADRSLPAAAGAYSPVNQKLEISNQK